MVPPSYMIRTQSSCGELSNTYVMLSQRTLVSRLVAVRVAKWPLTPIPATQINLLENVMGFMRVLPDVLVILKKNLKGCL